MRATRRASVLVAFCVLTATSPAWADYRLGKLDCVMLVAEPSDAARELGITAQALQDGLLERLKARIPNLHVKEAGHCVDLLYSNLNLQRLSSSGGRIPDYHANLQLLVQRTARIVKIKAVAVVPVWFQTRLLAGSGSPMTDILAAADRLLDQFGADYYKAGNQ
jgi:hypothetical protein